MKIGNFAAHLSLQKYGTLKQCRGLRFYCGITTIIGVDMDYRPQVFNSLANYVAESHGLTFHVYIQRKLKREFPIPESEVALARID